jgi:monovalent cation:H+ antiporter, CPA1 family
MGSSLITTLFALAGLLVLVSLMPPLARQLRLPLAVVLAMAGVALGVGQVAITDRTAEGMGAVGDLMMAIGQLDLSSAAFLYIFLPILLFEAALSVDVRRMMDELWPILFLAIVAVLACTFVAGGAMWLTWALYHGNATQSGLLVCLMLAAIVATTDPAAVIGIFRDVGAPRRLTVLVEGESLFNDAAAIALFTLLLAMVTTGMRQQGTGIEIVLGAGGDFVVKFLGGLLIGWLMGQAVGLLVSPLRDLPQSEITLTVAAAYLTFIIAEHYLHVSGVVAVVAAGLVLAAEGRTRISPESWEGLENVWAQLGFWANSLIFVLASMLVPPTLMNATWGHGMLLLALIIGATLARALVVFGLIPVLTRLGAADRFDGRYKAVMLWGGLRGAVSLALALSVSENRQVPDEIQNLVAVVATGYVLFTLLIQGTTLRPLISWLGLNSLTPVEQSLRIRAVGLSLSDVRRDVEGIATAFRLDATPAIDPLLRRGALLAQEQQDLEARCGPLSLDERVYIGLTTLARYEEQAYLRYFSDAIVARPTVQSLSALAARLQDGVKARGRIGYEAAGRAGMKLSRLLRLTLWLHRRYGWERPLARRLAERFSDLVVLRFCLRELENLTRERLTPVLGHEAAAVLMEVLASRHTATEAAIAALRLQYPAYVEDVQGRYIVRAAMRFEERTLRTLHDNAIINHEILVDLERDLRLRRRDAERPPTLDLGLDTHVLLTRVPFFAGLSAERLEKIERLLHPRLTVPEEFIVRRGERGDAVYFIASGAVAVNVPGLDEPVRLGSGDVFGEMALIYDQPRNADVVSLGYCRLLTLDRRDFDRLYVNDEQLRAHINDVAARRLPAAG